MCTLIYPWLPFLAPFALCEVAPQRTKINLKATCIKKLMDNFAGEAKFLASSRTEEAQLRRHEAKSAPEDGDPLACRFLRSSLQSAPVPFVHYIGLSKRPCYGCHLYLRAYNEIIGKHVGRT